MKAVGEQLDGLVRFVLEATPLLGLLEQLTGRPEALDAAAGEWHGQAVALTKVSHALRGGAAEPAPQWQGEAARAFAAHLGRLADAIDSTAGELAGTSELLATAARECREAERMAVETIREAAEWIAVELAASLLLDTVTAGLATVAEALVGAAQLAVFVGRVERVSVRLAEALRELELAVREMRQAEQAAGALRKADEARRIARGIREDGRISRAFASGADHRDWLVHHLVSVGVKGLLVKPLVEQVTGLPTDPADTTFG